MKHTVCVYMSTYNGEKYLREQLDSLLNQNGVEVIICIRDDGSRDHTVEIINEYIGDGKPIILRHGKNLGHQKSFMTIAQYQVDADFYAFSDQDDVWKKGKLARAVKILNDKNVAALYGGNIMVTNENMEYNGNVLWRSNKDYARKKERILRYYSLGYNMYGCTLVWNRKLQELIWQHMPCNIGSHDIYVTMLAGALGEIVVDKKPMIFHRMHENNTAGIETNILKRGIKGYKLYWGKGRSELSKTAEEIVRYYKNALNDASCCGMETLLCLTDYKTHKIRLIKQLDVRILGIRRYLWMGLRIMFDKY